MKGKGVSGGALTVINAIATGFGSAFGIGVDYGIADLQVLDAEYSTSILKSRSEELRLLE